MTFVGKPISCQIVAIWLYKAQPKLNYFQFSYFTDKSIESMLKLALTTSCPGWVIKRSTMSKQTLKMFRLNNSSNLSEPTFHEILILVHLQSAAKQWIELPGWIITLNSGNWTDEWVQSSLWWNRNVGCHLETNIKVYWDIGALLWGCFKTCLGIWEGEDNAVLTC